MTDLDSIPSKVEGVLWRVKDGEAVLVHPEKGQVKVLNEVGAYIWSKVDGASSIRDISEYVCSEYNVDQTESERDALSFLMDLEERGVLIFE
jgi:hypothetical protein